MGDGSAIEWCDATWQIASGCTPVSEGCHNCYSARLAGTRLKHLPPAFIVSPHDGTVHCFLPANADPRCRVMLEVGKRAAGRVLDGVEHNGIPEASS